MLPIRKPISVLMITMALILIGVQSGRQLQYSFLPDIEYPEFLILCKYPGSSVREVEKEVIQPLEEALSGIEGIREMVSWSRDELGIITLRFKWKSDVRYSFLRIREKIDETMDQFPKGMDRPSIMDFNPSSLPVLRFTLAGDMDLIALSNFAEDVIKPRLSQLNGVAGITISGMPEQAIQITIDNQQLELYKLKYDDIQKAIIENLPGKSFSYDVKSGYAIHKLTVEFPVRNLQDMLQLPIPNPSGIPLILGDIAEINLSTLPFSGNNFSDKEAAVTINVYKEAGSNTLQAAQSTREELKVILTQNKDIRIKIISDQGTFISTAISSLNQSILLGSILAFFTICLFFKKSRYALLLLLMIPITLTITFILFYFQGISLNFMTLGGIALAVGLIVDNGIVILDSVHRHYLPNEPDKSIYKGIQRVKLAVFASTLTTISIFFPVVYIDGYISIIFKDQAWAIVYTLLVSLLISLYVIPALYKLSFSFSKPHQIKTGGRINFIVCFRKRITPHVRVLSHPFRYLFTRFISAFDQLYQQSEAAYHRGLFYFLNHKSRLFFLLLFTGVIVIIGWNTQLSKQYWPDIPSNRAVLSTDIPDDIPYSVLYEETQKTIDQLLSHPAVEGVYAKTFDPRSGDDSGPDIVTLTPGFYTIVFELKLLHNMDEVEFRRMDWQNLITLPVSSFQSYRTTALRQEIVTQESKNICIYFQGTDDEQKLEQASRFREWMEKNQKLENVEINRGKYQPALKAVFKDDMIAKYPISPSLSAQRLKIMNIGEKITVWAFGDDNFPIVLKSKGEEYTSLPDFMNQSHPVGTIALRNEQLFDIEKEYVINEIKHVNKKRVISVEADVPMTKMVPLIRKINRWIRENPSESVNIFIAEQSMETATSLMELFKAFILATLIVYLLLAAQFESLLHPLNIMLTVPVGFAGAVLALLLTGGSLNVISLIGIVMLIGIGVNDAILKLDYMLKMRTEEQQTVREAILSMSKVKFRPVLMTTMTTIMAMLPMALGYGGNSEINQPLAVTVIGGLTLTTFFTLFITPVFFELFENNHDKIS
ncbi:efflux RND transporter permease subunit [Fidelibacter multiformis]